MARKNRTLAGFGDVASDEKNNNNINTNDDANDNANKTENTEEKGSSGADFLDKLLDTDTKKKEDLVLTGVYLQPQIAKILDSLGKKGGRGAKSRIVNDALRKLFHEKGLI